MSHSNVAALRPVARLFALISVAGLASCGDASAPVGVHPGAPSRLLASDMTVDVLPVPAGVSISQTRGVTSAGYIFAITVASGGVAQPYVWTQPYTAPGSLMTSVGSVEGLDGPDNAGDVAGFQSGTRGFWSFTGSSWTFTGAPAASYTNLVVSGVNTAHAMSGWGFLNGTERALWWSDPASSPVELPMPNVSGTVTATRALALNDAGAVVGDVQFTSRKTSYTSAVIWTQQAGVWSATVLTGGGSSTRAYDINDAGQVAGNGNGAVLWTPSGGSYTATIASSSQGALTHLDACGRLIGYSAASSQLKRRAWVWANGVVTQLPLPGGTVATEAQDIAADPTTGRSIIVGIGRTSSGAAVPVRWTIPGCV